MPDKGACSNVFDFTKYGQHQKDTFARLCKVWQRTCRSKASLARISVGRRHGHAGTNSGMVEQEQDIDVPGNDGLNLKVNGEQSLVTEVGHPLATANPWLSK